MPSPLVKIRKRTVPANAAWRPLHSPHVLVLDEARNESKKVGKSESMPPTAIGGRKVASDRFFPTFSLFDFSTDKKKETRAFTHRPRGLNDFPPADSLDLASAIRASLLKAVTHSWIGRVTYGLLVAISVLPSALLRPFIGGEAAKTESEEKVTLRAGAQCHPGIPPGAEYPGPAPAQRRFAIAGFAAAALVFVLPLGTKSAFDALHAGGASAMEEGRLAIQALVAAGQAVGTSDFAQANDAFVGAEEHFSAARRDLGAVGALLGNIAAIPGGGRLGATRLLDAGEAVSSAGRHLASAMTDPGGDATPLDRIRGLSTGLADAAPEIERAALAVAGVPASALPEQHRSSFETAKDALSDIAAAITHAASTADLLTAIVGAGGPRRYLVVFQNDAELRPTGGFIGSFALIDVKDGRIEKMEIPGGGSYDLQGWQKNRVRPPLPLRLISSQWEFRDANWSPDFPTTARRLTRFYENAGGPTVDGVIAVNSGLLERVIDVIGPVAMPEYGKTLDADNALFETQKAVEIEYDREANRPKQFIADLAPKIFAGAAQVRGDAALKMLGLVERARATKDIQLWFRDGEMQNRASSLGWTGEMAATDGDFIGIVHANLAGGKTDQVMTERVAHHAKILPDGSTIISLTIERTHGGRQGDQFTGVRNVDYLRVFAPMGSMLIDASGFDAPDPSLFSLPEGTSEGDAEVSQEDANSRIDRASGTRISIEHGKTVFGNWVQTDPGETSVVALIYRLPAGTVRIRHDDGGLIDRLVSLITGNAPARLTYSLHIRRQAGAPASEFDSTVEVPIGYLPVWQSPARVRAEDGSWNATQRLESDAVLGFIAEK